MSIPPAMFPAQNPARKRKKWPWIVGPVVAVVLITTASCATGGNKDNPGTAPVVPAATAPTPAPTTDPSEAASASSAARASRETAAASASSAAASRSSEAAHQSSTAEEAQRTADEEAHRKANEITYSVTTTGSGISMVSYLKPAFSISQETNIKGKRWSKTIQADGSAIGINMNAQNAGGGTITCKIVRGGEVISENSSSGDYAFVSCG
ncbi:MAG: hypothetical protein QOI21_6217 [Actinomycetota bacterium]|nr:hypothetical protein [Actinomycetota bacterium]